MSAVPAPMTPEDCDLRGYEWMPLFGGRLFSSTFEAHASDLAFRVAIKLYWECWQQVPAASLPNDDVQLCRLAGLGRDLKSWRKLRADGVLHGFILCADDRLYHKLIADEAVKAWECRQKKDRTRDQTAARTQHWRERKREDVTRHNGGGDASHSASRDDGSDADVTRSVTSRATRQDSTVQDRKEPSRSPPTDGTPAPPGTPPTRTRANGTNPRQTGTNPRSLGSNPRAKATNPRASKGDFVSGGIAVLAERLLQIAEARQPQDDDLTDESSYFRGFKIVEGGRG